MVVTLKQVQTQVRRFNKDTRILLTEVDKKSKRRKYKSVERLLKELQDGIDFCEGARSVTPKSKSVSIGVRKKSSSSLYPKAVVRMTPRKSSSSLYPKEVVGLTPKKSSSSLYPEIIWNASEGFMEVKAKSPSKKKSPTDQYIELKKSSSPKKKSSSPKYLEISPSKKKSPPPVARKPKKKTPPPVAPRRSGRVTHKPERFQ